MSKLHPRSLKCIFLGYSWVQKRYQCYCPSLRRYLVSADVKFLENVPFSQSLIHISQGEDDDLLIYNIASQEPTHVPTLVKPPIILVYSRYQNPPVSSPKQTASLSNPVHNDDLPITFHKGKCQCARSISTFCSCNHLYSHSCSSIASLDSISHCLTMFMKPY